MKAIPHGSHLIQLSQIGGLFNCYFVKEDDGLTLIDTGLPTPGSVNAILKQAQTLEMPIQRILITHAHADHCAKLDELYTHLPKAQIMVSQRTARFLSGEIQLEPDEPQSPVKGSLQTADAPIAVELKEGDQVESLQVIRSPGHTPDHTSFFDSRDGTLIAGDAWQTQFGVAVIGTFKLLFPFPAMATWHRPTALASAKKLRDLNPKHLAVGHGNPISSPTQPMDDAIKAVEAKWT